MGMERARAAEVLDNIQAASHGTSGPAQVEALFSAFAELSALSVKAMRAKRERQAEARRLRARTLYAARKAAGTLPKPQARGLACEPDYEPQGCSCHTCRMPPCGWCSRVTDEEG